MQWYYTKEGQQCGPVEEADLFRLAQAGEVQPDDLVWNESLGDAWIAASSVENLFASSSDGVLAAGLVAAPMATGTHQRGSTHNRDLMGMARDSLKGNWGLGVGVVALYFVIDMGVSFLPLAGFVLSLLISGPMAVGYALVFLTLARRSPAQAGQLFYGFSRFGTALGAYFLMILFILLWSLLLIVPGIMAAYSYMMTFFIIADDPTVGALQALTRSKEMMRGNRWKLFCLYWRFFGWSLLCILTLGIGFLWLAPYMQTSLSHFYDDVRPES